MCSIDRKAGRLERGGDRVGIVKVELEVTRAPNSSSTCLHSVTGVECDQREAARCQHARELAEHGGQLGGAK